MKDVSLLLGDGVAATLLEFDEKHVSLLSAAAYPPGTPVAATAVVSGERQGPQFQVKVRRCRREPGAEPARFRIEGRWVNLSRQQFSQLFGPD